ncbi:MAG TPA: dephospho-CoA kinase [Gemmataceae bacterium]|nr:dephospho-CoA kinase [Gemmataceae bacterium]
MDRTRSAFDESGQKPVIGLIGGIGSGKSRVAAEFARRGARIIAGDQLGHEALRQPDVKARVVERWGPDVLDADGEVNRRKVAAIVFADTAQLRGLEAIVFPWIESRIAEEIARAQQDPAVALILLDAAVLLEAGWNKHCDWIVYVHTPRDTRLARLASQRGWTAKEVDARANAQLPLTEKVTRADFVVDNSGPLEATARQVDDLLRQWGVHTEPANELSGDRFSP